MVLPQDGWHRRERGPRRIQRRGNRADARSTDRSVEPHPPCSREHIGEAARWPARHKAARLPTGATMGQGAWSEPSPDLFVIGWVRDPVITLGTLRNPRDPSG